jgi:Flp pilus assembly protein TadG
MIRISQLSASPIIRALRSFDDCSGSVATEFALILPITALLLSGVIEFGIAVNSGTALENGARAGAQFAIEQGLNAPGIKAVVANASNLDPDTLTVTSREFWECSGNWGTEVDASTNCGTGVPLANFIEVKVTQTYTPIFSFLGSLTPAQLNGTATVRVPG